MSAAASDLGQLAGHSSGECPDQSSGQLLEGVPAGSVATVATKAPVIPVLLCADSSYLQHLGATVSSLLMTNRRHAFRILVCGVEATEAAWSHLEAVVAHFGNATIEAVAFDRSRIQDFRIDRYLSLETYLRLFITEYIDDSIDKLLYLDCDMIVLRDIAPLWAVDVSQHFLAAAPEPYNGEHAQLGFGPNDTYFNTGLLLLNMARWRAENPLPQFLAFEAANRALLTSHDQDVLNVVFRHRILVLSCLWNFKTYYADIAPEDLAMAPAEYTEARELPGIVHFTGRYKPWLYLFEPHYKQYYLAALAPTAWKDFVPADRTARNRVRRLVRLTGWRQRLNWRLPRLAKYLRQLSGKRSRILAGTQPEMGVPRSAAEQP